MTFTAAELAELRRFDEFIDSLTMTSELEQISAFAQAMIDHGSTKVLVSQRRREQRQRMTAEQRQHVQAQQAAYRERNRDHIKELQRAWYQRNREQVRSHQRAQRRQAGYQAAQVTV